MIALRKFRWREQPVPNACPLHPDCTMQRVIVANREYWQCSHPKHIVHQEVVPARVRAKSLPDTWRLLPPPLYVLPPPQATGAMQAVVPAPKSVEQEIPRTTRPAWLEAIIEHVQVPEHASDSWLNSPMPTEHASLRLMPEECKDHFADADKGIDSDDTTQAPALLFLRHSTRKG